VTGYRNLDGAQVAATVARLRERIDARFDPPRGLGDVAGELGVLVGKVDTETDASARRVDRTRLVARAVVVLVVGASLLALGIAATRAAQEGPHQALDWLPLIESAVNDAVFAGIAVLFLWALPERLERRRLLAMLHELRSLAHVIDMHQLSKDPERVLPSYRPTPASPRDDLGREQLHHYFDYCSELLSLVAKTAALCAEHSTDAVILETVRSIESLTTDMSMKIWQKISLLPHG
jgi:hypothetical protein